MALACRCSAGRRIRSGSFRYRDARLDSFCCKPAMVCRIDDTPFSTPVTPSPTVWNKPRNRVGQGQDHLCLPGSPRCPGSVLSLCGQDAVHALRGPQVDRRGRDLFLRIEKRGHRHHPASSRRRRPPGFRRRGYLATPMIMETVARARLPIVLDIRGSWLEGADLRHRSRPPRDQAKPCRSRYRSVAACRPRSRNRPRPVGQLLELKQELTPRAEVTAPTLGPPSRATCTTSCGRSTT